MRSDAQTAVVFDTEGRIIPVRIRFYDIQRAEYISSDIEKIYYCEKTPGEMIYSVRLKAGYEGKLIQDTSDFRWSFEGYRSGQDQDKDLPVKY